MTAREETELLVEHSQSSTNPKMQKTFFISPRKNDSIEVTANFTVSRGIKPTKIGPPEDWDDGADAEFDLISWEITEKDSALSEAITALQQIERENELMSPAWSDARNVLEKYSLAIFDVIAENGEHWLDEEEAESFADSE